MAAVMLQVIASFYTNYSKNSLFLTGNTFEKYFVSIDYCIACHDDKMCFLPICSYYINLIANIKELLQKLDAFCSNYQDVDCLHKFFKNQFSGKIVVEGGQLFNNVQRAVHFSHQQRGVDGMPSIAKTRLSRKKYKNIC